MKCKRNIILWVSTGNRKNNIFWVSRRHRKKHFWCPEDTSRGIQKIPKTFMENLSKRLLTLRKLKSAKD